MNFVYAYLLLSTLLLSVCANAKNPHPFSGNRYILRHLLLVTPLPQQLFFAAQHGLTMEAEHLLRFGFDADITDETGKAPIHVAIEHDQVDFLEMLARRGANLRSIYRGLTPLALAIETNSFNSFVSLMALFGNAAHETQDADANTVSHYAAASSNPAFLAELARIGADFNRPNRFGRTAIFNAVLNQKPQNIRVLRLHGADTAWPDRQGITPLMIAERIRHSAALRALTEPIEASSEHRDKRKGAVPPRNDGAKRPRIDWDPPNQA